MGFDYSVLLFPHTLIELNVSVTVEHPHQNTACIYFSSKQASKQDSAEFFFNQFDQLESIQISVCSIVYNCIEYIGRNRAQYPMYFKQ